MSDILTEIVARKRCIVAEEEQLCSISTLEREIENVPRPISMRQALTASATGIIAEFKRKSPSKGWIKEHADASLIPPAYAQADAAALSILTDEEFFGGSLDDVRTARPLTTTPILRKDFVIGEYQLYQARAVGANAALLIAACLDKPTYRTLKDKAHALGLEILLEIHSEAEMDYIDGDEDMIGINNRDLGTFHTDVQNSFRLASMLPKEMVKVSESGISKAETIIQLREAGFRGFLIGETFMKTEEPSVTLTNFIQAITGC